MTGAARRRIRPGRRVVEPAADVPLPPLPETFAEAFGLGPLTSHRPGQPIQLIGDLVQVRVHLLRVQPPPPPAEPDRPDPPRLGLPGCRAALRRHRDRHLPTMSRGRDGSRPRHCVASMECSSIGTVTGCIEGASDARGIHHRLPHPDTRKRCPGKSGHRSVWPQSAALAQVTPARHADCGSTRQTTYD